VATAYGRQILENFSKITQEYWQQQPWQPAKEVKFCSLPPPMFLIQFLELLGNFVEDHCMFYAEDDFACKYSHNRGIIPKAMLKQQFVLQLVLCQICCCQNILNNGNCYDCSRLQ
jgi:hypothetical protein